MEDDIGSSHLLHLRQLGACSDHQVHTHPICGQGVDQTRDYHQSCHDSDRVLLGWEVRKVRAHRNAGKQQLSATILAGSYTAELEMLECIFQLLRLSPVPADSTNPRSCQPSVAIQHS